MADSCVRFIYNFTKGITPPWVFFTFFKLHKWYWIVESITFAFRYGEEHHYNYLKGRAKNKKSVIGHFTQIVWRDTTRLGVGIASKFERQNSGIRYFNSYVVARYMKLGNVEGHFRQKVMPKVEDGMYYTL